MIFQEQKVTGRVFRKNFTQTSKKFTKNITAFNNFENYQKHPSRYTIPLIMGNIKTTFFVLLFDSFVFDGF
jgi:hypothetical protein